ncbi:MAG: hypothetical protein N3F06_00295, partial [Nitrososphaerales archaeon]|nr:hypothetical protein [Nitrososphaerales archaeon]
MSDYTLITDYDVYLFKQGRHYRLYEKFGSHIVEMDGKVGTYFAVWAPNASNVYVMGSFNEWNPESHPLSPRPDGSGIWEGYISGVDEGTLYKYRIISKNRNYWADKSDPFAYYFEVPPKTASIVWSLDYEWKDDEWMKNRREYNSLDAPFSIYEVHMGSWRRVPE